MHIASTHLPGLIFGLGLATITAISALSSQSASAFSLVPLATQSAVEERTTIFAHVPNLASTFSFDTPNSD